MDLNQLLALPWFRSLAVFVTLTIFVYRWDLPRSLSRGIAALRRDVRSVKGSDWLEVFARLGVQRTDVSSRMITQKGSYRRLYVSLVLTGVSVFLMLVLLPLAVPYSFAQLNINIFPLIQNLVAGFILFAALFVFAGSRSRPWRLHQKMRGACR